LIWASDFWSSSDSSPKGLSGALLDELSADPSAAEANRRRASGKEEPAFGAFSSWELSREPSNSYKSPSLRARTLSLSG